MTSPATVFVVDDEEPVRHAFEVLLDAWGIPVQTFSSAEAFLQAFSGDSSERLFLDMRMPGMNGAELYKELRRRNAAFSLVLMTGHGSVESVQELLGGEAVVLEKPFSAADLKRCLFH